MMDKIIAFQKMMLKIFLPRLLNTKLQTFKKNKRAELSVLIMCSTITYLFGFRLFGGYIGMMMISIVMLPFLYGVLSTEESIIFHLPLKRTFVITNIYIFPIITNLIFSLTFFIFISLYVTLGTLFSGLFGSNSQLPALSSFIAITQEFIIIIFYSITYINGIMVSFFVNKFKIRIAIIIIFTAIYSAITFYLYNFIPKDPKENFLHLANRLLILSNSWVYVAIAFCVALIISIGGVFILIRLDSPKRNLQNI